MMGRRAVMIFLVLQDSVISSNDHYRDFFTTFLSVNASSRCRSNEYSRSSDRAVKFFSRDHFTRKTSKSKWTKFLYVQL